MTTSKTTGFWIGKSGKKYTYKELGDRISREHPDLNGSHILEQLSALGLNDEFSAGHTPTMLPYSFTYAQPKEVRDDELASAKKVLRLHIQQRIASYACCARETHDAKREKVQNPERYLNCVRYEKNALDRLLGSIVGALDEVGHAAVGGVE